jgi:putative chitinase
MQLTEQALRQFAPKALDEYVQALVSGAADLEAAGITSQIRLCHFLAQAAMETAGFSLVRENTAWTPEQMCAMWPGRFKTKLDPRILACRGDPEKQANLAYSNREDLGNLGGDDGWAYRGGSFPQLTGRDQYNRAGTALGIDLEGEPHLIEDATVGLKVALWHWLGTDCNRFADRNYLDAIGNAWNRGNPFFKGQPIGAHAREQWLVRAWAMFGQGPLPNPAELGVGARGPMVGRLQHRLKELGYQVGEVDQIYGYVLARAVAGFKLAYKHHAGVDLEPEELVGEATWAALEHAPPAYVSQERKATTPKQLAAMGSTETKAGMEQMTAGSLALTAGIAEGARQTGVLDGAMHIMKDITAAKLTLLPALDAIKWGLANAFWVVIILLGIWVWTKGRQGVLARLAAHVTGFNLSR